MPATTTTSASASAESHAGFGAPREEMGEKPRKRRPPPLALSKQLGSSARAADEQQDHHHRHHHHGGCYPLPAYCRFVPGGVAFLPRDAVTAMGDGDDIDYVHLSRCCGTEAGTRTIMSTTSVASPSAKSPKLAATTSLKNRRALMNVDTTTLLPSSSGSAVGGGNNGSAIIVRRALIADAALREHALRYYATDHHQRASSSSTNVNEEDWAMLGHRLPSLSHLAHSALVHPLTAVPASNAVEWAESMIMEYMDGRIEELINNDREDQTGGGHYRSLFSVGVTSRGAVILVRPILRVSSVTTASVRATMLVTRSSSIVQRLGGAAIVVI